MLLLLILFSGCLASCAAQTTSFPFFTEGMSPMETTPLTQSIQATTVLPSSEPVNNVVAILQTAVQSSRELNETTVTPLLIKLHDIIQQLQPGLDFGLTVKKITQV
ncbi:coiled-coil domain-containing protein 39 [Lates japonicus]|uniref:Coiled-coil domain-containing protein 39 n=1 Tax=Lates japonicus TaxID=270547 RepID=A0AAD3MBB2_LATJO|nr:coiled-coil domain-containing protein 39 [Lates japonicus]